MDGQITWTALNLNDASVSEPERDRLCRCWRVLEKLRISPFLPKLKRMKGAGLSRQRPFLDERNIRDRILSGCNSVSTGKVGRTQRALF